MSGFDVEKLEALGDEGWLRRQRHPDADLWIYNYTEKAQYEKHWTPETLACRGLILDGDGAVVARPFPKFFNLGDPLVGEIPDESFTVREKVDGSLGILYRVGGEAFIATRGSFVSEQAKEGTAMLSEYDWEARGCDTPLFEIVFPSNRIVIDYGDRRELVLLAVLDNETGAESAMGWGGPTAELHQFESIEEMVEQNRPNAEGYVVTYESGLRVKIKHADYVRLHRIITGVNARHIWEALKEGQDPVSELDGVPDEIFGWIETTASDLREEFNLQRASAEAIFSGRPKTTDRRELAEYFKGAANPAVLFRMLDGKPFDEVIWKQIRPEPTTPDTVWTSALGSVERGSE